MTIDLEDNYCDLPFEEWTKHKSIVVENTRIILDLLSKYNAYATFFTLGYIAERYPELIEEIKIKGHEIASHSYAHIDLRKTNMKNLELDLKRSVEILTKTSGEKILGFRAPYFSINRTNSWVLKIIRKYFRYDSSIFPAKMHYGIRNAPRFIYRASDSDAFTEDESSNFFELPPATFNLIGIDNIPIAGGFYLRFLPFNLVKIGISKLNESNHSAICYIHPSDIDPARPRIPQYSWHYYWGQRTALKKFESLLRNFRFISAVQALDL